MFKKLLLIGSLVMGLGIAPVYAKEIIIKFSYVTPSVGNPKGEAATLFAKRVNSELKGKVKVILYPSSQLFNDSEVAKALVLGEVQMAAPSLSKVERLSKVFRVFDLPFLFKDMAAVTRFEQSKVGQSLLQSMKKRKILGLVYWHNGMKQLSANKPLIKPEDAKGLKFRIQPSKVLEAQFKALGASPQKIPFSEVYGALQTGVVEGQENTWSNIYTKKFYEVQDGITQTNHGVLDYIVITSTPFWDGLPADIRTKLDQILKEVTTKRNKLSVAINIENKKKIIAAGTVVHTLTPEQREAWVKKMKPVWKKFEKEIGPKVINAAKAANNS